MKFIISLLFLFIFNCLLIAQIPHTISYQGMLTDASGNPKPDGNYQFTFYLYESPSGGSSIWSEVKTIAVSKGLFSTSLGDATPFGSAVQFDKPYWLGIKVNTEPELTPRVALNSSGFSLTSDLALNVIDGAVVKSLNNLKDDVTLEGAGGTTISTNGNTITITSSGGSGSGIQGIQNTNNTLDIINPNGPTATVNVKVPLSLTGSASGSNYILTTTNSGTGHGIIGISNLGYGTVGISTGTFGETIGVVGNSSSPDGYAISGWNLATTGNSIGVIGRTNSSNGIGVRGLGGSNGIGVWGSSTTYQGVFGQSQSNAGIVGSSQQFHGVYGVSHDNNNAGVIGINDATGFGVIGTTNGDGIGVYGQSVSGNGIYGESNQNAIYGKTTNSGYYGVVGVNNSGGTGILASGQTGLRAVGTTGYGISATTNGTYAVVGQQGLSGNTFGALGCIVGSHYNGVYGYADGSVGSNFAVAIFGKSINNAYSGWFAGNVQVAGNFYANEKNFRIDHPLDPANKYLIHSCVESSDRMNIYNGNVITDANGSATINLPAYFQSLNIDYKYQLTVIGQFAQAIIESEISNNQFTIKTDKPNVKVSWQVTGIRNDEYAKQNPFIVEKEKEGLERGKYLMPELFGQPETMGINYMEKPEKINFEGNIQNTTTRQSPVIQTTEIRENQN